jgi:hypothetical protein
MVMIYSFGAWVHRVNKIDSMRMISNTNVVWQPGLNYRID